MSLKDRVQRIQGQITVEGNSDGSYQYRYVTLSNRSGGESRFNDMPYGEWAQERPGQVLEIKDGEESLMLPYGNLNFTLKVRLSPGREYKALSFRENNEAIHISRVFLRDGYGNRVSLGSNGTVCKDTVWYLPEDANWGNGIGSFAITVDHYCADAVSIEYI